MRSGILILGFWLVALTAQATTCLEDTELRLMDNHYERALKSGDKDFLSGLLAEDFIWVHNLGSDIENRQQLLTRMANQTEQPFERSTREVSIHRMGQTAVVAGVSEVVRAAAAAPEGSEPQRMEYRFMRTYVLETGRCRLLAVQTMKVWSNEELAEDD